MTDPKPISRDAVQAAIEKARHYRLLNEPAEAESICLDVLQADPENQPALVTLLLALTDRFGKGYEVSETRPEDLLARLRSEYDRAYYGGIIQERRAKAHLHQNRPGAGYAAFEFLEAARKLYEKAEALRPPGNDEAVLRWNTCARLIERNKLQPRPAEKYEPSLE